MIKCNLAVILAERGIKITELSEKTGLSRTTLTQLTQNSGKGIQFDTMNKLCTYLDIDPGDLFSYLKFDVKIEKIVTTDVPALHRLDLVIKIKDKTFKESIMADIMTFNIEGQLSINIKVKLPKEIYSNLAIVPADYIKEEFTMKIFEAFDMQDYEYVERETEIERLDE